MRRNVLFWIVLALSLVVPGHAWAQAPTPESREQLVERAAGLLADAEAAWADDREGAESTLREGVALLEAARSGVPATSVELERTLGASYLLLGDTGRSVLHLRRALLLDPADAATRETLAAARARVGASADADLGHRAARGLLFWRGYVPRLWLLVVGVAAWVAAWALLVARRLGAPRVTTRLGLVSLVVSLLPAGALASEQVILRLRDDAVVVQRGATAHNGPSADLYPATFTEPVQLGLELLVVGARDGWVNARLASGQETWLPESAIERVTPRRRPR